MSPVYAEGTEEDRSGSTTMARLVAALVLLCACISLVAAHGTIVLNEVAPVSGDSVEIADDFFTRTSCCHRMQRCCVLTVDASRRTG